jgi:3-oxoacyl-[acyl-carrier-protein] synthase-3
VPLSTLNHVRLAGIACAVPLAKADNRDSDLLPPAEIEKIIKAIGIEQRRVSPEGICTSDLCVAAADRLLADLGWLRRDVEAVIFVTQTPDFVIPATAVAIQARLQLPQTTLAFDVNLGCSGYVYGLSILGGLMSALGIRKGLLLAGDTPSKITSSRDRTVAALFGDAGSATALELSDQANPIHFDLGGDGSGWKAIHIPAGGYRRPVAPADLEYVTLDTGVTRNASQVVLDGAEIFNFSIREVPKTVNQVLKHAGRTAETIDYFLFHQANLMMNEFIRKKLKLPAEKVPYSLRDFGNTSSATIPLTLLTNDAVVRRAKEGKASLLMCGFGVGLSWGSALVEVEKLVLPPLIEL